jgi:hypothetical protein
VSSQYERELRQVIAGVPAGVEAVIKSCTEQQKSLMRLAITRPFLVVRAAGSGMEGTGDLLALRGDICFPIEVKTTKASKLYLSGRTMDQYLAMINEGQRCNLMPLYAHRRKGIRGDYLNWQDGMPLHKFIALVCSNAAEQNQTIHNLEVRAIRTDIAAQLDISKIVEEQVSAEDEIKNQTEIFAELARRRSR